MKERSGLIQRLPQVAEPITADDLQQEEMKSIPLVRQTPALKHGLLSQEV
jgi:hypothetical protein